ncbi:dCTP deaminase [Natronoarchaeum rubrum]|uniref:dCTP deaminase n=1 Tax=Natronoarchaeum rubrum TaxID=755311 RepID=UPI002111BFD0|nr:dCTP deaminase [Natronoarchaeum rubrum]
MPTTDELASRVEGIVHEKTQRTDAGLDLTVAEIYEVAAPGRVDFGGGELESADLEPHERTWRDEEDDYQWWHLDAGQYLIEYNESLTGDQRVPLQIRDALRERGASHPTLHVAELPRVPLSVGGAGIRIKENARVSTLLAED